jgi:PIN domain nuclease of toxin-antitoxin system
VRLLLDTHLLLWAANTPARLSRETQELLTDEANTLVFSVASLWEITIKTGLRRPAFDVDPAGLRDGLLDNGYDELLVEAAHVLAVTSLPPIHGDPFDRMLVAQAIVEGVTLLTADPLVARYPGPVRKV